MSLTDSIESILKRAQIDGYIGSFSTNGLICFFMVLSEVPHISLAISHVDILLNSLESKPRSKTLI